MWLVRNQDGSLTLFTESKPFKKEDLGIWACNVKTLFTGLAYSLLDVDKNSFPSIRWEDSVPIEIDLIGVRKRKTNKEQRFWIARDSDGELHLFTKEKPCKDLEAGFWMCDKIFQNVATVYDGDFPAVQWEDKEPTEVELIIKM